MIGNENIYFQHSRNVLLLLFRAISEQYSPKIYDSVSSVNDDEFYFIFYSL